MRRTAAALAAVALGVLALLVPPPRPAAAQPAPDATPHVDVELVEIEGIVAPDADLRLRLQLTNLDATRVTDLRATTTVHLPVPDRAALAEAAAGRTEGVWTSVTTDLDDLGGGVRRLVDLEASAADLFLTGESTTGVYPLEVTVFADARALGTIRTAVVALPEPPADPLRVATAVEVDAPPARLGDGPVDPAVLAELRPGGRLWTLGRELTASVADGTGAGLTLLTSGRLLQDLADLADGFDGPDGPVPATARDARHAAALLEDLTGLVGRADVDQLALPHGPADLVALVRGGLGREAVRLVAEGRTVVEDLTGQRPRDDVLVPPDGIDAETLVTLSAGGIRTILLPDRYLASPDQPDTASPVRRLRTADGSEVTMLVPDPDLGRLLDRGADAPAVLLQRLLAETALVWLEGADDHRERGLLLAPPAQWSPQPGLLSGLLDLLGDAPWIRPVSVVELARTVDADDRLVRLAYPGRAREAELPPDYVAGLGEARAALAPLASILPEDDDTPQSFARQLLGVASVWHRRPAAMEAGRAVIEGVLEELASLTGAVEILQTPPVTLTAATGQVPVTLVNSSSIPLQVRVRVASERFEFAAGDTQDLVLDPGEPTTITFAARALSPGGLSGVQVVVEDPEGTRRIATERIAVRSTAYPLAGIVVTAGGAIFLALWWWRDHIRRRQARTAAPGRRRSAA